MITIEDCHRRQTRCTRAWSRAAGGACPRAQVPPLVPWSGCSGFIMGFIEH